jgi:hypothetical protein
MAACKTFGMFPPRAFRIVAILFIFTLNLVILLNFTGAKLAVF